MSDSTLFLYHLKPYGWVWATRKALGLKDGDGLPYDYPPKDASSLACHASAKQNEALPEEMSKRADQ